MELAGKRVLITGGAVRVGAALAAAFAGEGARISIHFRHSEDAARRLLFLLPGGGHDLIDGDLADPEETDTLFRRLGHPADILINNASLYDHTAEDETRVRQVNVLSPVSLMEQFASQLESENGAILNILDGAALQRHPAQDAYTASRAALAEETLSFARRLAPKIRVNALAPGPVIPPVWLPASKMEHVSQTLLLKRPVRIEDLTAAALFLCKAESMTGVLLPVDCGLHLN